MRICWFDGELDDEPAPADWRVVSWILAPVFLNFTFWLTCGSLLFCPLPLYAMRVAAAVLISTAIFFLGPAMAVRAAQSTLVVVIQNSIGSVPAFALRVCFFLFLIRWISALVGLLIIGMPNILQRDVSNAVGMLSVFVLAVFVFIHRPAESANQRRNGQVQHETWIRCSVCSSHPGARRPAVRD